MLRALIQNKERTFNIETEDGQTSININYRYVYPQTEDLFTAAVFSRLCYLDGDVIADIFSRCIGKDFSFGDLVERNFWPSWGDKNKSLIIPDVFMRFKKCDVIIEAKRYDGAGQSGKQIEREINAYFQYFKGTKFLYLFAAGGVSEDFFNEVQRINCDNKGVEIYPLAWRALQEAIKKSNINIPLKEDLLLAFELQGIRELLFLKDLTSRKYHKFSKDYKKIIETLCLHIKGIEAFSSLPFYPKINDYKKTLEVLQWE